MAAAGTEPYSSVMTSRPFAVFLVFSVLLTACSAATPVVPGEPTPSSVSGSEPGSDVDPIQPSLPPSRALNGDGFAKDIAYDEVLPKIARLGADFSLSEAKNLDAVLKEHGITLSSGERAMLEKQKFTLLRLPETSVTPKLTTYDNGREFLGLYNNVSGGDPKSRTPGQTLFWTADVFLHSYSLLEVELLKEMENTAFAPSMRDLTKTMFDAAEAKLAKAPEKEKAKWTKIRNYFAVPYALFSTSIAPLTDADYRDANGAPKDPASVKADFVARDKAADTEKAAKAFVAGLGLDAESNAIVLGDLVKIFAAAGPDIPSVFAPEYKQYASDSGIKFSVDFSQFTPRSHYTSSSLRRQYFRGMNWYIQLPFFVGSDALTEYAFGVSELLSEHPDQLKSYALLESTINFLVGASDDLMPADYLRALAETKGASDQAAAIREYLIKAKAPKIKSIAAEYPTVGKVQSADVLAATKGMRFFSGKYIMDSAWTGFLTQGDEAPRPGYPAKLPPMTSSLEVMGLLGSSYAASKIPTLDFYTPENGKAVQKAMGELKAQVDALTEADWRENAYIAALWTIRGLFGFEDANRASLPAFMQSVAWPAKTLQTAAGFWTELRHTVLLYAKQSFAEKGGGGPCDERPVPEPPKAYIEPQPIGYRRLQYLAQRTQSGLESLGFDGLKNIGPLARFSKLMTDVIAYTDKELGNASFSETVVKHEDDDANQPNGKCVWYEITQSDWENLRRGIVDGLDASLPIPVEGAVLPAKDRRAALVADVHTGGDSDHDTRVLYEANGVPNVILVAVKDANGPRVAIGFTYAQYEFTKPLTGPRMTDEEWQKSFYQGDDDEQPFVYTPVSSWPAVPSWYASLFAR